MRISSIFVARFDSMQILEAELRLQYAVQYRIPYPRLEHKTHYKGQAEATTELW